MKLALNVGYASGATLSLPLREIRLAEELGYDSVWTAETYGSDVFSPLAFIAARTSKIRLGSGIAQLAARTPTNCAMIAQTIEALAGTGRMIVGLGVSGPQVVEGWYGQPWGKPAERLRDYVAIMRQVWRREAPVRHRGAEISIPFDGPGSKGLGKPLKSILRGNPNIPVFLGTSTPGNIRLAGEIADGWLSMHFSPLALARDLKWLREGFALRSDRQSAESYEVAANLRLIVTEDVKDAFAAQKPTIALYVGGMGAKDKNFHKDAMTDLGLGEAAARIQELFLAGYKDEAAAAVPDDYIDECSLVGSRSRIAQRFRRWQDSGATMLRLADPNCQAIKTLAHIWRRCG